MRHDQGTFKGAGGLNLYYQSWQPQARIRANLVIVHGLGSHSGWFNNLVQYLVPRGYRIYGFDLRGHGRSPGQRGHINTWAEFREDLSRFLQLIARRAPGLPCFLLGHSLGGAIALDYGLRFPQQLLGVIAIAPPLGKVGVSPLRIMIGRMLSWLWPNFSLNTGIDRTAGSRDPAIVTAYADDPLRHTKGTARLATEFLATVAWLQAHAVDLQVPLLILQGGADRITAPQGSRTFFQQVALLDKAWYEYVQGYHDLQNDIDYQDMLSDLGDWLELHLQELCPPTSNLVSVISA
ncbi:MAG: alpha/beta hydrolase [Cyanothece sp. SIO1E1]|nr:alpha/beta hydrolase [Cyanothece sp. SIO1E1]